MRTQAIQRPLYLVGAFLAPTLFLAGCGPSDNDPGPGGVSVGEARALDEAAEMIEARRLPPGMLGSQAEAEQSDGQNGDQDDMQENRQPQPPQTQNQTEEEQAE